MVEAIRKMSSLAVRFGTRASARGANCRGLPWFSSDYSPPATLEDLQSPRVIYIFLFYTIPGHPSGGYVWWVYALLEPGQGSRHYLKLGSWGLGIA